jgi:hypothetical protein
MTSPHTEHASPEYITRPTIRWIKTVSVVASLVRERIDLRNVLGKMSRYKRELWKSSYTLGLIRSTSTKHPHF